VNASAINRGIAHDSVERPGYHPWHVRRSTAIPMVITVDIAGDDRDDHGYRR
jgi:hypothetical protein